MVKMSKEIEEGKFWAFLGVFLPLVGFILVLLAKKENKYAMFYARQGLVLFIVAVIIGVSKWFVGWIPVMGWLIVGVLWIILIVLWIMGLIYSFSGEEKDIPLIGEFAKKIKV